MSNFDSNSLGQLNISGSYSGEWDITSCFVGDEIFFKNGHQKFFRHATCPSDWMLFGSYRVYSVPNGEIFNVHVLNMHLDYQQKLSACR
jgi:hypothetical protein